MGMNPKDKDAEKDRLLTLLDEIVTNLDKGAIWHRISANECGHRSVRGWQRWHAAESDDDHNAMLCLTKLVSDSPMLRHICKTNPQTAMAAHAYSDKMTMTPQEFEQHHKQWAAKEREYWAIIVEAVHLARCFDVKVYKKLLCLQEEVENEIFNVEVKVCGRLGLSGWSGHDIGIISEELHDYFEHHYTGGEIDFNIG